MPTGDYWSSVIQAKSGNGTVRKAAEYAENQDLGAGYCRARAVKASGG